MRRYLRWPYVVPALALVGFLGVRTYTRSDSAADLVREQIEAKLGVTAEFGSLRVGLTESSITSLKVQEPNTGPGSEPFLTADRIDVDMAGVGAIRGKGPSSVRLHGVRLLLRFDRSGELLTRFPSGGDSGTGSLTSVQITSGTLVIRQEGRPDSVIEKLNLGVSLSQSLAKIEGRADDPNWGPWSIAGSIPLGDAGNGTVTFRTEQAKSVSPELLRQVPFVSPNAWTHVGLHGSTTAEINLTYNAATQDVGYRVALEPTHTDVQIQAIGLKVADASGSFVAEQGVITLKNVRGKTASGTVHVNSKMDFSKRDSVLTFETDLRSLDIRELPPKWRVPDQLDGHLNGKLDLTITLPNGGGTLIRAAGKATVANAKLNGQPIEPVDLDIHTDAGGDLRFDEAKPSGGGLFAFAWQMATRIHQPNAQAQKFLHVDLKVRDVSVAELIQAIGVDAVVPVTGKLTANLRLDIPDETPNDTKTYRLDGEVTSGAIRVDTVALENVSAKLEMRDGKLRLKDFVGYAPKKDEGGIARVEGEMDVEKPHAFKATVKFEKYPLARLDRLQELVALSGLASADATIEGTLDPVNIRSSGNIRVEKLKSGDFESGDMTVVWESDNEYLRVTKAQVRVFDGEVAGKLEIPLREGLSAKGKLDITNLDLAKVSEAVLSKANLKMEGKANGTLTLRNPKRKPGEAPQTVAEVELTAPTLKLQGISAREIKGTATYAAKVLRYSLTGDALGGEFDVSGQYPAETPPAKPGKKAARKSDSLPIAGRLKLRRAKLSAIWPLLELNETLKSLDGEISLDFPFSVDEEGELVGAGRVRTDRLTWKNKQFSSSGEAIVRLGENTASFEDVSLFVGEGVVRAFVTYNQTDAEKSEATVSLSNVPAGKVLMLMPELATRFDLPVDGRLTTSLGREWRGSGVLTSNRGKIYGVPVTDLRIPIEWTAVPSRSRSEIRVRDATATAAGGQVGAHGEFRQFNDLPPKLSGGVQFRGVNLSQAMKDGEAVAGKLTVTGKLSFAAEQFRKANDLTAKIDAKLGESQPFSLPIFSAIAPFLGVGNVQSATVREGDVKAVLANGVWRIQRFSLTGSSVDLYADGTMNTNGRLNLDVTAYTRQSPDRRLLQRIIPIPSLDAVSTTSFTPATLASLTGFMGRYVVYLNVSGTTDSPYVRLQPLRTLTEDAARFFLFRFLSPLP